MRKKVVFVIPYKEFRDEEYFTSKEILDSRGFQVKTASSEKGVARGADGGEIPVDLELKDIEINDFDALVFIGGPGCLDYLDNEESYQLLRDVYSENKIIGAICISPIILARAGILKQKKATVWSSNLNKEPINILKSAGAEFINENVVVDGNIITANGPDAAEDFGKSLAALIA